MAKKRSRQTFEKIKREQAVKEKRVRKQERRDAAKAAKLLGDLPEGSLDEAGADDASADTEDTDETETPENAKPGNSEEPPGLTQPLSQPRGDLSTG